MAWLDYILILLMGLEFFKVIVIENQPQKSMCKSI